MTIQTRVYEREVLYEQVWERPVRDVAADYGVSGVALAKMCRRLAVPRPPRGYWAKVRAGKKASRRALGELPEGVPERLEVKVFEPGAVVAPSELAQETRAVETKPRPPDPIPVPDEIGPLHRCLRGQIGRLRKAKGDASLTRAEYAGPDIRVSPGNLDRAQRVLNALFKALDAKGYKVEVTEARRRRDRWGRSGEGRVSQTGAHINGEFVTFELVEERRQVRTRVEKPWPRWDTAYEYTGQMGLHIPSAPYGVRRKRWRDGKTQRLEDLLPKFIVGLGTVAEAMKNDRFERERQQREYEERERQREAARQARALEKRRVEDLDKRLARFESAGRIRDFASRVQRRGELDAQAIEWVAWALNRADELESAALKDLTLNIPEPPLYGWART